MKYKRIYIENSFVHIVVVTYNRYPLLINNINLLLDSFKNAKKYFDFKIVAICVLPEHFHMILNPKNINEYPKIITAIKYYFSKRMDDVGVETPTYGYKNKGEKGIWQRRYYEHTIRDEEDLNRHLDYIHYNPVKHRYVKNVKEWKFSSFEKFVKKNNYDINWGSSDDVKHIETMEHE